MIAYILVLPFLSICIYFNTKTLYFSEKPGVTQCLCSSLLPFSMSLLYRSSSLSFVNMRIAFLTVHSLERFIRLFNVVSVYSFFLCATVSPECFCYFLLKCII